MAFASTVRSSAGEVMSFGKWDISEWYLPPHCGAVLKGRWDIFSRFLLHHRGAVLIGTPNPGCGSIRLVPLSHAGDHDLWICGTSMSGICYFIAELY